MRGLSIAHQRTNGGFTLIEVILSLFIFSLIATTTLFALRIALGAGEQLERSDRELRQLQITRLLIKEDLAQLLARPVRDEFGNISQIVFRSAARASTSGFDDQSETLMGFVRNGWTNPDFDDPRPSVQYVEYLVRGTQLIRAARPFLDQAPGQPTIERILLDDVSAIEISFLTGFERGETRWATAWPLVSPSVTPAPGAEASVPRAVQLTVTTGRYGTLAQRFWVGRLGAGAP